MKRCVAALLFLALSFVSTPGFAAKGVLLVAFGTSQESALASFRAVEKDYRQAYPGQEIVWAYTSDIIRKKLAKQGRQVLSVDEALEACAKKGMDDLVVQSLHVSCGEEYSMLQRIIVRHLTQNPGRFKRLLLGHPLLESAKDLDEVIDAVMRAIPRKKGEALLLMGHGNDRGAGDLSLARAKDAFHEKDPLALMATVEGANCVEPVLKAIKKKKAKVVHIAPFMLVAGDHAHNDLAGDDEDSWASRLKKQGVKVVPHLKGLGEYEGIRKIYLRHSAETTDDLANPKKSDWTRSGAKAEKALPSAS